ncbi:hypothetical protein SteCoe_36579 [Stentor coeruleus]|uniref:RRM domain-containing protein n=1 Tax=Stentor coeruleus TaxID=5963 RepID=A0A1R2APU6_9CILI|nr:hypothetical protein SteCoe_36579 [Stentor coeruleus]
MPIVANTTKQLQFKKNLGLKQPRYIIKSSKSLRVSNPPSPSSNSNDNNDNQTFSLPIPKGSSTYAQAKTAEYAERNIDKAEQLYRQAILENDRKESAIKDLASLLHQKGRTNEACELLKSSCEHFQSNTESFMNLLNTLQNQQRSEGNSKNKIIKISGLQSWQTEDHVKNLFKNPLRIKALSFDNEKFQGGINYYCIVQFNSHSSARKTLEGFCEWDRCRVEWVSSSGNVISDAHYAKQRINQYRKDHPTFEHVIFDREMIENLYALPIDFTEGIVCREEFREDDRMAEKLLGKCFCLEIF